MAFLPTKNVSHPWLESSIFCLEVEHLKTEVKLLDNYILLKFFALNMTSFNNINRSSYCIPFFFHKEIHFILCILKNTNTLNKYLEHKPWRNGGSTVTLYHIHQQNCILIPLKLTMDSSWFKEGPVHHAYWGWKGLQVFSWNKTWSPLRQKLWC